MIACNAFTYTKGLREEITFSAAPALHRTSGPLLALKVVRFIRAQIESRAPNPS